MADPTRRPYAHPPPTSKYRLGRRAIKFPFVNQVAAADGVNHTARSPVDERITPRTLRVGQSAAKHTPCSWLVGRRAPKKTGRGDRIRTNDLYVRVRPGPSGSVRVRPGPSGSPTDHPRETDADDSESLDELIHALEVTTSPDGKTTCAHRAPGSSAHLPAKKPVGVIGFEPTTSTSRSLAGGTAREGGNRLLGRSLARGHQRSRARIPLR